MTPQTSTAHHPGGSPGSPGRSAWALVTQRDVTWRQATEGWAVVATLGALALGARALFKVAKVLRE